MKDLQGGMVTESRVPNELHVAFNQATNASALIFGRKLLSQSRLLTDEAIGGNCANGHTFLGATPLTKRAS